MAKERLIDVESSTEAADAVLDLALHYARVMIAMESATIAYDSVVNVRDRATYEIAEILRDKLKSVP